MRQKQVMFVAGLCLALITFYCCGFGEPHHRRYKAVPVERSAGAKDTVYVDTKTCTEVALSAVRVYQDGDDTIVKGDIKRRNSFQPSRGHVQVVALSDDGKTISQVQSSYYPRNSPGKPRRNVKMTSSFTARLPLVLPDKASVRIMCGGKEG